jgi:hypothetical protein
LLRQVSDELQAKRVSMARSQVRREAHSVVGHDENVPSHFGHVELDEDSAAALGGEGVFEHVGKQLIDEKS